MIHFALMATIPFCVRLDPRVIRDIQKLRKIRRQTTGELLRTLTSNALRKGKK